METKLQELTSLITLLNRNVSKEDFASNFKILIDFVKELKRTNALELGFLDTKYTSVVNSAIEETKQKIWDYCISEIEKMILGFKKKSGEIDKRLAEVRDGKDGKDVDETTIVSKASKQAVDALKPDLLTIRQVEENISTQGDLIANTLEALPDKKKLEIEAIKDLRKELDELRKEKGRIFGGGGFSVGALNIHIIDDETPTNSGDDLNFTINHLPSPASSLKLYRNGQRLRISEDFTLSGLTITLLIALGATEILLADYRI